MKKSINFLWIIIIVIFIIVGSLLATFLIPRDKPVEVPEYALSEYDTKYFEVFRFDRFSQLNSYCTENKMPLQIWEEERIYRLANVPINGKYVTLIFETDDGENFKRINGKSEVFVNSKEEIFFTLESVKSLIADFFGLESIESYHVYNNDGGELNINKQETIDSIAEGKGVFCVSAIDDRDKYWNLTLKYAEEGKLAIEFFCSFDKSIYVNGSEDIVLLESKE